MPNPYDCELYPIGSLDNIPENSIIVIVSEDKDPKGNVKRTVYRLKSESIQDGEEIFRQTDPYPSKETQTGSPMFEAAATASNCCTTVIAGQVKKFRCGTQDPC